MKTIMKIVSCVTAIGFAASIAMAGCGGGGSEPQGSFSLPPQQVIVAAMGDSTTRGMTNYGAGLVQSPNNVPILEQTYLRSHNSSAVSVINYGTSGAQVVDILNGTGGYGDGSGPFQGNLTKWLKIDNSKIVIAKWAINDAIAGIETVQQYHDNLTSFITQVKAAGKTVILEEPNPVCDTAPHSTTLDTFVGVLDTVASEQSVTLISQYNAIKSISGWQSQMSPDCIHPLDSLYAIIAANEEAALQPVIGPLVH